MAQTGFTPLLIYSSSTGGNTPSAANLLNNATGSELAINIADGKLFYKDSGGSVQVIGWKTVPTTAGGTGLTNYTAGDMVYWASGTAFTKLGIGSSNTVMTSSGSAPQWSTSLSLAGSVTAAAGLVSTGTFTGTPPSDGIVVDYSTGWGRFSTFTGDGYQWFNAGVAGTELMRLTSSGYLGIGNNNPTSVLSLYKAGSTEVATKYQNGSATNGFVVGVSTAGEGLVYHIDNQPIRFATNNTEQMRLFASGGLSLGNTTDPGATNASVTGTVKTASSFGYKNRFINGYMVIDQRNAGAAGTGLTYTVDRFGYYATQAGKLTWQQNNGGGTLPAGFSNYLGFSSNSAFSIGASDYFSCYQSIEGYNVIDLGWGTASAKTITISFWVYASITGTYSVVLGNINGTRCYLASYTVNSANTWEYKTITIAGDTTGTWTTDNRIGVSVSWSLGAGSSVVGSAGSWSGTYLRGVTGQVNVTGTNGAIFRITGTQFETGTQATPFEIRNFQREFDMCQRYYETTFDYGTAPANGGSGSLSTGVGQFGAASNNLYVGAYGAFKVTKRGTPALTLYGNSSGYWLLNGSFNQYAGYIYNIGVNGFNPQQQGAGGFNAVSGHYAADAEL